MAQILVVDDEVGIRELLSEILADEGHQVLLAESAGDARRLRERARPDLVLLDIWMPDTDGITLLKEWAASGQLTMPVVMMSGPRHHRDRGRGDAHRRARFPGEADRAAAPARHREARAAQPGGRGARRALALAALGRSTALADAKKRLAQLAAVGRAAAAARRARHARRSCSRACSPRRARRSSPAASMLGAAAHRSCSPRPPAASCSCRTCRGSAAPSSAISSSCWRAPRSTSVRVVSFSPLDVRSACREARVRPRARRAARRADASGCRRCASSPRTCPTSPRSCSRSWSRRAPARRGASRSPR